MAKKEKEMVLMQLKKETGYALHILLCMAEAAPMSIKEICSKTRIPWQPALRTCRVLVENGCLKARETGNVIYYLAGHQVTELSMYDVIRMTEGENGLFSLLSQDDALWQTCGRMLAETGGEVEKTLKGVTIGMLMQSTMHNEE